MSLTVPTLDIVIVNWNSGDQLRECLASVAASDRRGIELQRVVVVDNASSDGSVDKLEFPLLPVTVIKNEINRGFGAACNRGTRGSNADYILFLNPDARVNPDTLAASVQFMESAAAHDVGIASVKLIDESGHTSRCCSRFPTLKILCGKMFGLNLVLPKYFPDQFYIEWDHNSSREVEQVQGAYLLMRRALFEALRGFDECFFVYLEDVDLGLRARQTGWKSYHYAGTEAFHAGGGTSRQIKARRLFYSLQSRLLYAAKHFSTASAVCLFLATLLVEPFSRVFFSLIKGSFREIVHTIQAYGMLYAALPRLRKVAHTRQSDVAATSARTEAVPE